MQNPKIKFCVSAPGKVILHGEHSVVYGKPAIAGPVNLRTYFSCKSIEEPMFRINYFNLEFNCTVTLGDFKRFLTEINCFSELEPLMFLNKLREDRDFIFKYVSASQKTTKMTSSIEMAVGVTLFLLNRILKSEGIDSVEKGCQIDISSDISIGAGIGSSASYGVCIAAGCYVISQLLKGNILDSNIENFSFNELLMIKISQWAFDSEVIMHERPSGIDNTIATYGNLIKFCRGEDPIKIKLGAPLNILIVDTATSRSTSKLVQNVAALHETFPRVVDSIFDAMGHLVDAATEALGKDDVGETFEKLEQLFVINNSLLRAIGVSHIKLEQIFSIADAHGFKSKLTGAGGGGCAIILLPPDYMEINNYTNLCDDLSKNHFSWKKTVIGGFGVDFKIIEE